MGGEFGFSDPHPRDEGLGQAMANSAAASTSKVVDDQAELIAWVTRRLSEVEARLGITAESCPKLPSEIIRERVMRSMNKYGLPDWMVR